MFKCKIDLAAYDKSNKTIPNPEFGKAKAIAKASVKKLASKAGETTEFYISKDYFENNGKPISHFFAVGTSKKLTKEFITKEMKGKGVAGDPKSAATGKVCVKNIGGKDKLCFEPHDKCKIPAGQWPKLLKALKPFFAGFKAVVIVDGQTLEEEPGGEEDTSSDADEDIVFEDAGADEQDGEEEDTEDDDAPDANADNAKEQAANIIKNWVNTSKNFLKEANQAVKDNLQILSDFGSLASNLKEIIVTDDLINKAAKAKKEIQDLDAYMLNLEALSKSGKEHQGKSKEVDALLPLLLKQKKQIEDNKGKVDLMIKNMEGLKSISNPKDAEIPIIEDDPMLNFLNRMKKAYS